MRRVPATVVALLSDDPDLGARLPEDQRRPAGDAARAVIVDWSDDEHARLPAAVLEPGAFGLLVLSGWLGLRMRSGHVQRLELVGSGDLVRPWTGTQADAVWAIIEPARLAVLDRTFAIRVSAWPEIAEALMERLVLRSRRLVQQMTAAAHRSAEDRVLLMLAQLGERWGVITPEGVRLPIPLTHGMLGDMTGTRRPATTTAIARLRRSGRLTMTSTGHFLIPAEPLDRSSL
jgi:CRP/FNR family cyclic AMP-dependent transcriptional regulator